MTRQEWFIKGDDYGYFSVLEKGNPSNAPHYTGDVMIAHEVTKEDARLIAAAPELLAAAKEHIAQFVDCYNNDALGPGCRRLYERMRAAIAKAEGKED